MKIFLDSYAILELLVGSAKGGEVRRLITESTAACTSALNIYEVRYRLLSKVSQQKAEQTIRQILADTKILPLTVETALAAAEIKMKRPALGAVDCNCYAIAVQDGLVFVTGDRDFIGLQNVKML
ncbi:MAG: PIN domain-containing protein [Candidatus Micrarchaeota archaeon]